MVKVKYKKNSVLNYNIKTNNMENLITIPIYKKVKNQFKVVDMADFKINYVIRENGDLGIVVNEYKTKFVIKPDYFCKSYKDMLLSAISEYVNTKDAKGNCNKSELIDFKSLERIYNEKCIHNLKMNLIPIKKEDKRDRLSNFRLIDDVKLRQKSLSASYLKKKDNIFVSFFKLMFEK